jgi:beta-glucanase (GH16 family)
MIYPPDLGPSAALTFEYQFRDFEVWDGKKGWDTSGGPQWSGRVTASGTMPYNDELEWYVNPSDRRLPNPFSATGGVLNITAAAADRSVKPLVGGQPYTSGMITTYHWFSQRYGFFEMRAALPRGKGLWPAFWLLPADGAWPPELDVMESLGHDPTHVYQSLHMSTDGKDTRMSNTSTISDTPGHYHVYAVDWEPDTITWYIDRKQVFQISTPPNMDKAMYLVINLTVGGEWPGKPEQSTAFPAKLAIDYIRVYAIKHPVSASPESGGRIK